MKQSSWKVTDLCLFLRSVSLSPWINIILLGGCVLNVMFIIFPAVSMHPRVNLCIWRSWTAHVKHSQWIHVERNLLHRTSRTCALVFFSMKKSKGVMHVRLWREYLCYHHHHHPFVTLLGELSGDSHLSLKRSLIKWFSRERERDSIEWWWW